MTALLALGCVLLGAGYLAAAVRWCEMRHDAE
jgi:hypothetical protein